VKPATTSRKADSDSRRGPDRLRRGRQLDVEAGDLDDAVDEVEQRLVTGGAQLAQLGVQARHPLHALDRPALVPGPVERVGQRDHVAGVDAGDCLLERRLVVGGLGRPCSLQELARRGRAREVAVPSRHRGTGEQAQQRRVGGRVVEDLQAPRRRRRPPAAGAAREARRPRPAARPPVSAAYRSAKSLRARTSTAHSRAGVPRRRRPSPAPPPTAHSSCQVCAAPRPPLPARPWPAAPAARRRGACCGGRRRPDWPARAAGRRSAGSRPARRSSPPAVRLREVAREARRGSTPTRRASRRWPGTGRRPP
jgi:hypothetical protein